MDASQVWKLFEKTGNIGVYMLYKKLSDEKSDESGDEIIADADSCGRNCDKGN